MFSEALRWDIRVEHHEAGAGAVAELPALASGEAWVFSPQWLDILTKIKFRRRRTFDSGATPKVGGQPRPPATLAEVDLAEIQQAMADTIERAEADDPAVLRRQIRRLQNQLTQQRSSPASRQPEPAVETVVELERPEPARRTASAAPRAETDGDGILLRSGARRMVESLGRMAPLRLTKSQWGTVAHLKTSSGTWSTYLSDIRRAGLIDESDAGFTLSEAGFAYLGGRPDPMTAAEMQNHYRRILRAGAAKMLDALIQALSRQLDPLPELIGLPPAGRLGFVQVAGVGGCPVVAMWSR